MGRILKYLSLLSHGKIFRSAVNLVSFVPIFVVAGCGGQSSNLSETPPAGSLLVVGADTNRNGVWDHIESDLNTSFGASDQELSSAVKFAIAMQNAIIAGSLGTNPTTEREALTTATKCIFQTFGASRAAAAIDSIVSVTTDSESRVRAYLKYNSNIRAFTTRFDGSVNYCV